MFSFENLWALNLPYVDEPNHKRGGTSSVSQLRVDGVDYFLKRQVNYTTRSLLAPFGEMRCARENRNLKLCHKRGVNTVEVAFFGMRKYQGQRQSILLTRALDKNWRDLAFYLQQWSALLKETQTQIITACGSIMRCLHNAKLVHCCFYPKHVFLKPLNDKFSASLIDLERMRTLYFGKRDRLWELATLQKHTQSYWNDEEQQLLIAAYNNNLSSF